MWRAGKRMKSDIESRLEASSVRVGRGAFLGVLGFTLLMITREGMETALLMNTLLFSVQAPDIIAGAVAGTLVAAFIAWLWSRYGHRVNLARFFQVTAVFLLVFVVQLLIYGFHELTEANIFPQLGAWHDATEPYGPDGIYGQYLTYMLVVLPVGWLALSTLLGAARGSRPARSARRPPDDSPGAASSTSLARRTVSAPIECGAWQTPMPRKAADHVVELIWEHDLVLGGKSGDVRLTLDSASLEGPSPMQALAFALAGCMAMDVVHVLSKGRHDLRGLRADLTGERSPRSRSRFTSIDAPLHDHRQRSRRTDRARHPAVAREVLLGLALDAAGHRLRRRRSRSPKGCRSVADGRREPPARTRRDYLDWLRGIAVLLMIEAHLFDSWTRFPDRDSRAFGMAMIARRAGAPRCSCCSPASPWRCPRDRSCAGPAIRAAASRSRRAARPRDLRAGLLFRLQAWILGWSHRPTDLLKVDILNIMGPSIVVAALLWRVGPHGRSAASGLRGSPRGDVAS